MSDNKMPRVMWLINHDLLRKYDVNMLKAIGIKEIFMPKSFPNEIEFRNSSVDWSEDVNLSIPADDLAVLNSTDWYSGANELAWNVANKYFSVIFFMVYDMYFLESASKYFNGIVLWRTYGLDNTLTYTRKLALSPNILDNTSIKRFGKRFIVGAATAKLNEFESQLFKNKSIYLPLSLANASQDKIWTGSVRKILFVCPDIGIDPYNDVTYKQFKTDFKGLPYVISGQQSLRINDPNVLGNVPLEDQEYNMAKMRLMYYESCEPNHFHYHPFEAIIAGVPLVFLAGGMLDTFGGINLPGRCKTIKEARKKIERILNDDWRLIEAIRSSQVCLLEPFKPEICNSKWREGFQRVLNELESSRKNQSIASINRKSRIAVILSDTVRGESLLFAKMLTKAIELGSRQAGEETEVVIAHLDDLECYPDEEFEDLPSNIKIRPYQWRLLKQDEAYRAMAYAGFEKSMDSATYQVPDDGIKQFMDCDLWVIISDRLEHPLLPVRPYLLMVYDYLQRYESFLPKAANQKFIRAAREAEQVFVTTEFTRQDAIQYVGLPSRKVTKLPMLAPDFSVSKSPLKSINLSNKGYSSYFLWTTNLAPHKNHANALKALQIYYEQFDGKLECRVTGVNTNEMLKSKLSHLKSLHHIVDSSSVLKGQLKLLGDLPDLIYQDQLKWALFVWHAGRADNGTFSVIEAAHFGVPALSSDYPAMREIDNQFGLNLSWMDAHSPEDMAQKLKIMESKSNILRDRLPNAERLSTQSIEPLASTYWHALRDFL